jgi:hypothetical protein
MALDRHQQLMLDVRQADRTGLILAPALKTPQGDAEREQVLEVLPGGLCQLTPPSTKFQDSLSLLAVDRERMRRPRPVRVPLGRRWWLSG